MDQYQALLDAADELCIVIGVTGAAWLNATRADPGAIDDLVTAYGRGVTQGSWVSVARKAAKAATTSSGAPHALTAFARKPTKSWLAQLDELTKERNNAAHGMRPRSQAQAAERLDTLVPSLETALRGASYLGELPWILTTSSSYRAHDRTFDVAARLVMGDHPEFEPSRWKVTLPLENDRVYLIPDGREPIDMTPFIVVRNCEVCRSPELFHSDRRPGEGGTILKNAAGHGGPLADHSLDEEFRRLQGG
ncbi:MAG: hypothetical protein L0I76_36205 [Pseudonocardia sp.]|nr:hypothetical protein [Pseudonocardia sp.]